MRVFKIHFNSFFFISFQYVVNNFTTTRNIPEKGADTPVVNTEFISPMRKLVHGWNISKVFERIGLQAISLFCFWKSQSLQNITFESYANSRSDPSSSLYFEKNRSC